MRPLRQVNLGEYHANLSWRDNAVADLSINEPLAPYPNSLIERFEYWVRERPEQIFIARRDPNNGAWRKLTYADAWQSIQALATALNKKNLSAERPIAILSGNSIEHALLALAAMSIGVPFAPISPQYSLLSTDFAKLKYVLDLIAPGLIFADRGQLYEKAIAATVEKRCPIVVVDSPIAGRPCEMFADLMSAEPDPRIINIYQQIHPDDIAKFLFSSGSTGMPKAVTNTHRMLCANQQMLIQTLPFVADPAPVIVDWLPWNHTFGGNHNVGLTIYNGGSLYIDDGKPTPKDFQATVNNLKEISPTIYFNVPKGYEELVKALKADSQLREKFFSRLHMLFYAGAGISQPVWDALEDLALETCGERILIVTGLGCTETAPSSLFTTGDGGFAGWIGLPVPGCKAKLVKAGGKMEIRIKGDHVTPGYWREPELTAQAFDDEGYYRTGDAVKFTDPDDIQRGLVFDGRISEDFKLDTGTWVSAGPLRVQFLNHFGSCVKDVVIAGRDKPYVSALVFPDMDVCRQLDSSLTNLNEAELCQHEIVGKHFADKLISLATQATGSASRICAIKLLADPPSMDKNEITDKGSLNASAIQDVRKGELESIYSEENTSVRI